MERSRAFERDTKNIREEMRGNIFFSTEVEIVNISAGGIGLESSRMIEGKAEYTLTCEERGLSLQCSRVWYLKVGARKGDAGTVVPVYRVGMRFSNVHTERMEEVMRFMAEHNRLSNRRFFVRFSVEPRERALLSRPLSYTVRKADGDVLLIETEEALLVEDRFPLEISVPGGNPVRFMGRVSSCSEVPGKVPVRYGVDMEFFEISGKDRREIREYLKSLKGE